MKNVWLVLLTTLFFYSCSEDFGTTTVTYTKAVAEYGDIDALRNTPIQGEPRVITNPGKIFISPNALLIGEEGIGIHVLDNTDPTNPRPISFLNIPNNREFFVDGNDLYAESLYDMLRIDISDMSNPRTVARANSAFAKEFTNDKGETIIAFSYEEVTETLDVGSDLYESINAGYNTFYYDFKNNLIPPSAVPASFAGNSNSAIGSINRIAEHNGYVYSVSRAKLHVFSTLNGLEHLATNPAGWDMETIYPFEDRLFVGARRSVQIFDITNPEAPQEEASFFHQVGCDPVYPVNETTAYVTIRTGDFEQCPGNVNELLVLNVESQLVSTIQSFEMQSPFGITLIGDKLYVGEGENGLRIFDATDRRSLVEESFDQSVKAYDVLAHPTRSDLLLIAGPEGLYQYTIGDNQEFEFVSQVIY